MRKKIYDIIPPNKIEQHEQSAQPIEELEVQVKEMPTYNPEKRKKSRKSFKGLIFAILAFLIVGGGLGFYFLIDAKAEVKIYPRIQQVSGEKSVVVAVTDNFELREGDTRIVLSGKEFNDEQTYTSKIRATGSAGGGGIAKGKIKVYNNFSPATALTLKTGTHFLSNVGEKSYHSISAINLPAATSSGPGVVEIEIEADEPGEDYNIESAKFSVPKLNGTEFYSTTWAETSSAITGGAKGDSLAVSQNDINTAKDKFKIEQLSVVTSALSSNIPSDYVIVEGAIMQDLSDFKVKAKSGDKVDSFDVSGKIKTRILAVKKVDLENLLGIIANLEYGKSPVYRDSKFSASGVIEKNSSFEMNLTASSNMFTAPDNDEIIKKIAGKSKEEAILKLKEEAGVEKVEIDINPSWKGSISNNKDNIIIKIETSVK
ncbi:MAG: hypothetical protein WCX30_03175 [Candidatus Paceibacterota bacterium]|jgi:hypothetical protein|nr:hypothetical protein [bacterium]